MQAVGVVLVLMLACALGGHVFPMGHHKRTTNVLKAGQYTFPLQGNINQYAEFFVNISIGSPTPQILRVQVDTGSTDLVVYATGCDKCPTASNVTWFDPAKSKSNDPIDCDDDEYDCDVNNCWDDDYCPLEIQYGGGGSINGYAATDTIALGALSAHASMGLIQQISGPFENIGVDGCWGFAYEGLSSWGDGPVVSHMIYDHKLYASFSLCLTETNPVLDVGVSYQGDSSFEWTKVTDQDWYTVDMEDFSVGGVSLGISHFDLNENGVIVDSGTTLFIVSSKVNKALEARFNAMCSTTNLVGICNVTSGKSLFDGYCYSMTTDDIALFPNISTTLKGTSALNVPPQAYLWEGAGIEGMYCFGFEYIESAGGDLPIILGDIIMQNYHVVFDLDHNQVGFGPLSSCPTA
jgi:hypothetical protein